MAVIDRRKRRARKHSYDAIKILQQVWAVAEGICGKYLAASMAEWIKATEISGALLPGQERYSKQVRAELLSRSSPPGL